MIIRGTDINTFSAMGIASQRKNGTAAEVSENKFARRFDTFELSDFLKNYDNTKSETADISDIKQMLSGIKNKDETDKMIKGIAGYAYMEAALIHEAMSTQHNLYSFERYTEEKEYYQDLLNEADGIESSDQVQYGEAAPLADVPGNNNSVKHVKVRHYYEYIAPEGEDIDRDRVLQALANVQNKINELLNNTMEHGRLGETTTLKAYNKCARAFSGAFGVKESDVVLDENSFNKAFGKIEATEEDYVQKCMEKVKNLYKCYAALRDNMSNSLKRMSRQENGAKLASAVKKAIVKIYGDSYKNALDFAAAIGLIEESEKTEQAD